MGLSVKYLLPVLRKIQANEPLDMFTLEAELSYTPIAQARSLGLTDEWVSRIEGIDSSRGRGTVVVVRRATSGTKAFDLLETGDVILTVNEAVTTHFDDITKHTENGSLELEILRKRKVINVAVPLSLLDTKSTEHVVGWAGAVFQMPHKAVYQQIKSVPVGNTKFM